MSVIKSFTGFWKQAVFAVCLFSAGSSFAQDKVADNMLLYQRSYGGWPKHIEEVKMDYSKELTPEQKKAVIADSLHKDGTIDNKATITEIRYLVKAYKQHKNPAYLAAAEKGISYLLKAQHANGGWPQFYPDSSSYRAQITYNDNAMVNVLTLLLDVAEGKNDMDIVNRSLKSQALASIERGVNCIVKTQVVVNGVPTVWCAQHDRKTLQPVAARKFEPASLSGSESAAIVAFLMKQPYQTAEVKKAVNAAMAWFEKSKVAGFEYKEIEDASLPKGKDKVLVPNPTSTVWARFYDIETNEPIFAGRDAVKRKKLSEIEVERRTGYAYYGVWPQKLIDKDYPNWLKKNQ
ncbi:MAG: pectate lyase [Segetibacter sp.]|nr:pectate lyase [Segetibacter sp.]